MKIISNHEPKEQEPTDRETIEGSEWQMGHDGVGWRLYPPGNNPYVFVGPMSRSDALRIAGIARHSFELGKRAVRETLWHALGADPPSFGQLESR